MECAGVPFEVRGTIVTSAGWRKVWGEPEERTEEDAAALPEPHAPRHDARHQHEQACAHQFHIPDVHHAAGHREPPFAEGSTGFRSADEDCKDGEPLLGDATGSNAEPTRGETPEGALGTAFSFASTSSARESHPFPALVAGALSAVISF